MTQRRWADLLTGLVAGHDLDAADTGWAMGEILAGNATEVQIAAFAVALRAKPETVDEISGLADAMLANAVPVDIDREAVDVVGSGGDRANTVNISTMAAIVSAGAGARVVKHGNRAASSMAGTADCLEALGVRLDTPPQAQQRVLDAAGIVFLFAPLYHPSLRHAASARRALGIQTTFNFLGPLANPGRPRAQAVGVANAELAPIVAGVLAARGTRGLVFHGTDGLDELTTTTSSQVWLVSNGQVRHTELDPADLGVAPARPDDLVGGDAATNAGVVREVLAGRQGAVRDIVCLNAAATLLAFRGPDLGADLVEQLRRTMADAARSIDSGAASRTLDAWVQASAAA